jgi:hypothetical protein
MPTVNTAIRTRPGRCPTHGDVNAQKTVPTFKRPFVIIFTARRLRSALQPYRCPMCSEKAASAAPPRMRIRDLGDYCHSNIR